MKIKISNEDFTKVYHEHSLLKAAFLLNVSHGCVSTHAKRLGLRKRGTVSVFCSMKKNPNVIPGGLPTRE